jgi:archaeal flagellar protein FlaJ
VSFRAAYQHRSLVYGICIGAAVVVDVLAVILSVTGRVTFPFSIPNMLILFTLVCFIYPNFMEFAYQRWKRRIDDAIPRMLSDVTSQVKTGMNLDRALEFAAERDYGPLSDELKKLQIQLSLGMPFEDAVNRLMERVNTLSIKRTFSLLIQANKAGGRVENLLDVIQSDANDLFLLEKDRRTAIRPYVVIIYIAYGVFLCVSVLLIDSFFKAVLGTSGTGGATPGSLFGGIQGLGLPQVKDLFLQMALIESVFGGFGAGKLGEGSFVAGFKHVLVMATFTVILFVTVV